MIINDLLKCEVNLVVELNDLNNMKEIQGYFFHVIVDVKEKTDSLSGILLLDQATDNNVEDYHFVATLWLDTTQVKLPLNEQTTFNIQLVREYELLHLLIEEKSHVSHYLPITCQAKLSQVDGERKNPTTNLNPLFDEFLLRK